MNFKETSNTHVELMGDSGVAASAGRSCAAGLSEHVEIVHTHVVAWTAGTSAAQGKHKVPQ